MTIYSLRDGDLESGEIIKNKTFVPWVPSGITNWAIQNIVISNN